MVTEESNRGQEIKPITLNVKNLIEIVLRILRVGTQYKNNTWNGISLIIYMTEYEHIRKSHIWLSYDKNHTFTLPPFYHPHVLH